MARVIRTPSVIRMRARIHETLGSYFASAQGKARATSDRVAKHAGAGPAQAGGTRSRET